MQATFETSEYQDFNEQNNLTPMEISGDEVVAQLEEDTQRYADLVDEYGIDLGDGTTADHADRRVLDVQWQTPHLATLGVVRRPRAWRRARTSRFDVEATRVAALAKEPRLGFAFRTTCDPTLLEGGHADNALPQSASATINCRIFPGHSIESIRDELAKVIGDPGVTAWTPEDLPGAQGTASTFATPADRNEVRRIERTLKVD